jgi:hypothetical protein
MSSFLPHLYRLQEHTFQQMLWDRNELILGTWKKYSKFIENIFKNTHCEQCEKHIKSSLGIQWDHGGNTLVAIEIEDPPPFPKITHMRF